MRMEIVVCLVCGLVATHWGIETIIGFAFSELLVRGNLHRMY